MTIEQRSYNDADGATQAVHMDDRTIGGAAGDVPVVRPIGGAMDFGVSSTGNAFNAIGPAAVGGASGRSSDISCDGFDSLIVHVETTVQNATVKLRPWLKDASGYYTPLPIETVNTTATGHSGALPAKKGTGYFATLLVIPTYGAKSILLELTALSGGTVSVWAAAR